MPGTVYDPNDPSTWGPIVGKDANGQPVYQNQPGAQAAGATPAAGDNGIDWKAIVSGGIEGDGGKTEDAAKLLSGYGPIAGLLGGGGSGDAAAKQTALAQSTVAPSDTAAGDIYNRAIAQANSANAIQAPTAVVAPGQTSAQINSGAYNVNTPTAAAVEDATLKMQAYQATQAQASDAAVQNVKEANVTNVAAVPGADVAKVNTSIAAPTIGDAAQTSGVQVGGTTLGPEATALQTQELDAAQAIANGPSAAQSQFQAGESQVVNDQLAMAAASRGADRAGARREAMINVGASGAQNALSAAALSAQEQQSKNVAASTAYQGIGSQALTAATTQAQITSQQQQLQAQLDAAIAQGNTAAINSVKTQQAQLSLQAQTSTVQAGLNQQGTLANVAQSNTAIQQQKAMADAAAANTSQSNYAASQNAAYSQLAANQTGTSQANAAATTGASKDYANAYNSAAQTTASQQSATNLANAALAQSQAQANANRASGLETTNALQTNAVNAQNATNSIGAQTTNAANTLNTDQLRQQGATAALNAGTTAVGVESKNAQTVVDANKSGSEVAAQEQAATTGMIGAGIAKLSDERAKLDVRSIGRETYADKYGKMLSDSFGPASPKASPYGTLSDARSKQEIARLSDENSRLHSLVGFSRGTVPTPGTSDLPMAVDAFPAGARATPYGAPTYKQGNIDLNDRPIVRNGPGQGYSTLYSSSFHDPTSGKEVLIPGVRDGLDRQMTMPESIDQYRKTGQYLGKFDDPGAADRYAEQLHNEGTLSDARTKEQVDHMGMEGVADFTRKAPLVTYKYKPEYEDGGAAYKAGTLAQGVEHAGPLGRMFVDERPDGLKEVQYGPMAHAEAKGAQATADHALHVAMAAYRRAR